jgi:hypothetical protein
MKCRPCTRHALLVGCSKLDVRALHTISKNYEILQLKISTGKTYNAYFALNQEWHSFLFFWEGGGQDGSISK